MALEDQIVQGNVPDLKRYQFAEIAKQLGAKNLVSSSALEMLAEDMGIAKYGEGFVSGANDSEKGRETASKIYSGRYENALERSTVKDVLNYLGKTGRSFELGDNFKNGEMRLIDAKMQPYENLTLKQIEDNYAESRKILGKVSEGDRKITSAQIRKANQDKMIYDEMSKVMGLLLGMNTQSLTTEAMSRTSRKNISSLKQNVMQIIS